MKIHPSMLSGCLLPSVFLFFLLFIFLLFIFLLLQVVMVFYCFLSFFEGGQFSEGFSEYLWLPPNLQRSPQLCLPRAGVTGMSLHAWLVWFVCFEDRDSLCSLGWLGAQRSTCQVSWVLGLKVCTAMPRFVFKSHTCLSLWYDVILRKAWSTLKLETSLITFLLLQGLILKTGHLTRGIY